ncbi:hypothetical protein U1Q18_024315 [Sarracenia purpurea var. burkii]
MRSFLGASIDIGFQLKWIRSLFTFDVAFGHLGCDLSYPSLTSFNWVDLHFKIYRSFLGASIDIGFQLKWIRSLFLELEVGSNRDLSYICSSIVITVNIKQGLLYNNPVGQREPVLSELEF